jgi:hypothetical protein
LLFECPFRFAGSGTSAQLVPYRLAGAGALTNVFPYRVGRLAIRALLFPCRVTGSTQRLRRIVIGARAVVVAPELRARAHLTAAST